MSQSVLAALVSFLRCVRGRGHDFDGNVCRRCGADRGDPSLLDMVRDELAKRAKQ